MTAAAFPASARASYELGRLLAQENELQAALTHLEKAVAADPAHCTRGWARKAGCHNHHR